jgi:hypothetical protein
MDKNEFLEHAPKYYALAIAVQISALGSTVSRNAIRQALTFPDDSEEDGLFCLVDNHFLWERAIEWLNARGMIDVVKGPFGPELYTRSSQFSDQFSVLQHSEIAFAHYSIASDVNWLHSALYEVSNFYHSLGMKPEDFDSTADEWAPIQLDASDGAVEIVTDKLVLAVEEIRKDNGYAATFPDEREFVLDGLSKTVERLRTHTIAAGYIRDTWAKLTLVARRFKGAALEAAAIGAKQALADFVKHQGGDLLRTLWKLISGL